MFCNVFGRRHDNDKRRRRPHHHIVSFIILITYTYKDCLFAVGHVSAINYNFTLHWSFLMPHEIMELD